MDLLYNQLPHVSCYHLAPSRLWYPKTPCPCCICPTFTHALEPWTYPDITWVSCMWERKCQSQMVRRLPRVYLLSPLVQSPCNVENDLHCDMSCLPRVPSLAEIEQSFYLCDNMSGLDKSLAVTTKPNSPDIIRTHRWKWLMSYVNKLNPFLKSDLQMLSEKRWGNFWFAGHGKPSVQAKPERNQAVFGETVELTVWNFTQTIVFTLELDACH